MKSYKGKKKCKRRKRVNTNKYPLTGYVIYSKDSTLRKSFEWIITKGGISKTLEDSITYKDCYRNVGGANSVITRLTWRHTECNNCMFKMIPITFDNEDSVISLKDVVEHNSVLLNKA